MMIREMIERLQEIMASHGSRLEVEMSIKRVSDDGSGMRWQDSAPVEEVRYQGGGTVLLNE